MQGDPGLLQPESLSLWQVTADLCLCRRHSNTESMVWYSLCGVSGSWSTKGFVWALQASLAWIRGLILNAISTLPIICWGFSFALGHGLSFFGGIQHCPVDGCSAASCNFGVLTGEDDHTSFYSAIFGSPGNGLGACKERQFSKCHF